MQRFEPQSHTQRHLELGLMVNERTFLKFLRSVAKQGLQEPLRVPNLTIQPASQVFCQGHDDFITCLTV